MVQFNLLPDVKLEYIKTQKTKRTVMLGVLSVTALAVFIFVLLFLTVNVFQKQHLANLDSDIKVKTKQLKDVQDLDKVLTVQNQLKALPDLHTGKPAVSRMTDYLVKLTPADVKVTDVTVDYTASTMSINGNTGSLETVNRFADILKFTDYKEGENTERAFSEVVLSTFGVVAKDGRTTYGLSFKFNPIIFDNTKSIELVTPNIISTRSIVEKPSDLFEQKAIVPQEGQ